jgi:hypothetical protein
MPRRSPRHDPYQASGQHRKNRPSCRASSLGAFLILVQSKSSRHRLREGLDEVPSFPIAQSHLPPRWRRGGARELFLLLGFYSSRWLLRSFWLHKTGLCHPNLYPRNAYKPYAMDFSHCWSPPHACGRPKTERTRLSCWISCCDSTLGSALHLGPLSWRNTKLIPDSLGLRQHIGLCRARKAER